MLALSCYFSLLAHLILFVFTLWSAFAPPLSAGFATVDSSFPVNHFLSLLWGHQLLPWFSDLAGLLVSAGYYWEEHPWALSFTVLCAYTRSLA